VVREGSADGDRQCASCRSGTFSAQANASACTAWSECVPGTHVLAVGTATADRSCAACATGEYSSEANASTCRFAGACPAGQRQTAAATSTAPVQCAACDPGTSCAGGTVDPVACATGTWDDDGSAATACVPWGDCAAGTFVATSGTARTNRGCSPCEGGKFSTLANASACTAWSDCVAGTHVLSAGTATADRTCAACGAGEFSTLANASACTAWSDCVAGTHVLSAGTATADRTCAACGGGEFSSGVNASTCQLAGACPAGQRQTAAATPTSPVQCAACDPGTYCAGGTAAPVSCGPGTWDDDGNAASPCVAWKDCPAGQYVATAGSARTNRVCAACRGGDTTSTMNASSCSPGAWLLSYFGPNQDVPNDSLHLAYSLDGQRWAGLAQHQPVYQLSGMGTNHIRDPFVVRKKDGTFAYLATDWTLADNGNGYWSHPSSSIVVADSADLITFTNPRLVSLTNLPGPNGEPMHAWAPEAYYDADGDRYAIVWSGNDASGANRIYVSTTRDFTTIQNPTPDVLFDPGYSVIDATLEQADGVTYLFFKDETDNGTRGKDIQIARAPALALRPGAFSMWSTDYVTRGASQTVRQATEGPFALYQPEQSRWIMYADYYGNGGVFGGWTAPSLGVPPSSWTALPSSDFSFPAGVRHAHALRITRAELDALIAHHGVSHRVRTTYSESNAPFYLAHSWYHGIITTLSDRSSGQLPDDFLWNVVPGLADPTDPDLVSFVAIGLSGQHYLRIDSANPGRYPSCSEASNRGNALCWVASAEQNHLMWVDPYQATTTFEADATFRRVPALNGDASMVSLQWAQDPTRYLRHMAYQVFATPISGRTQQIDASFVIERE
jgi:hypothetical protein